MSTLKRHESIDEGCHRLVCAAIESAINELTKNDGSPQNSADFLQEVDAAFALIEPALPRAAARRDRGLLSRTAREIDATLRPARLLKRLGKLIQLDKTLPAPAKAYRKQLTRQAGTELSLNSPDRSFNPLVYRLVADLAELRGLVSTWPGMNLTEDQPPPGLRRSYTGARRLAQNPPTTPKDAERAAVAFSRLARQLAIVGRCSPALIKPQRKLIAKAASQLADHAIDLRLRADLDTDTHREWAGPVLDATRDLPPVGLPAPLLGSALAETPAAFARRFGVYWSHWQGSGLDE